MTSFSVIALDKFEELHGLWQCGQQTVGGDHPMGETFRPKFLADFWLMDELKGMRDIELLLEINQTGTRA